MFQAKQPVIDSGAFRFLIVRLTPYDAEVSRFTCEFLFVRARRRCAGALSHVDDAAEHTQRVALVAGELQTLICCCEVLSSLASSVWESPACSRSAAICSATSHAWPAFLSGQQTRDLAVACRDKDRNFSLLFFPFPPGAFVPAQLRDHERESPALCCEGVQHNNPAIPHEEPNRRILSLPTWRSSKNPSPIAWDNGSR